MQPALKPGEPAPPSPSSPESAALRALGRAWRYFFADPWDEIAREGERERMELAARLGPAAARVDARAAWVLVLCAFVMIFQEYWGDRPFFASTFPEQARAHLGELRGFAWWSGSKMFGYFVVPAFALWLAKIPLAESGFRWRGTSLRIYLWLYLAVLPMVVAASYTTPFQHTYPFYKQAARSWFELVSWEAMYGSSFFALEFFFRGFLLFPLRRAFGPLAIFVMDVPYCMIHFHKPVAEVSGAIIAGVILGTLALRTRSILGGVMLHVAVAWTMDLLSLWHGGAFPMGRWVGE